MPRKSATSAAIATTDPSGDVTMIPEAPPTVLPSSPKAQQAAKEEAPKQSKKKEQQTSQQQQSDVVSLDDLLLPRSIIQRLAKGVLPPNTSLQRDAVLALTKSATVFISLLASTANEMTERKTIQSQDVMKALREIELDQVMQLGVLGKDGKRGGRVEREVEVWESEVRGKRRGYRERVKARESGAGDTTLGDTTLGSALDVDDQAEHNEEHEHKRPRIAAEHLAENESVAGSTGTIEQGTNRLKLNVGRKKPETEDDGNEEVEDDPESEDEDFESAEEEQEPEETQDVEDPIDVDEDAATRRRNGALAPDGRVEIDGSDVDSD